MTISFVQASKFTLLTVTYSPVGLYLARFTTIKSSKPLPERKGIKFAAILLHPHTSGEFLQPLTLQSSLHSFTGTIFGLVKESHPSIRYHLPWHVSHEGQSALILSLKIRTQVEIKLLGHSPTKDRDRFQAASADVDTTLSIVNPTHASFSCKPLGLASCFY